MRRQNTLIRKSFKIYFVGRSIFHISQSFSILCQNISAEKMLQRTFCDQTLYITNACRVISRITKVALLHNSNPRVRSFCLRTTVLSINQHDGWISVMILFDAMLSLYLDLFNYICTDSQFNRSLNAQV